MTEPLKGINYSVSTYQSADGSNFTTAGYDFKFRNGLGAYVGIGTDYKNNLTGVFDFKESNPYKEGGIISQNLRIRTKCDERFTTTQIRFSPCTVNIPVGEKTTLYVNPHYVGQYNYESKKYKNGAGIFAGVTQKVGKDVSVSLEGQRYNLQDISDNGGGNWSINTIISIKLP